MKRGSLIAGCLLLVACHRHPAPADLLENMPVAPAQKVRALDAMDKFRVSFNAGACQPIYDQASMYFRSQDSEEWLRDCQRLRQQLGLWRRFQLGFVQRCAKPEVVVCVVGSAEFETQSTEVSIDVALDEDRARLRTFSVRDGDQHWTHMPPLFHPPRWADPPPAKSPENGIAL